MEVAFREHDCQRYAGESPAGTHVENGGAVGGGDGGFIVGVGGVDAGCVTYHDAAGFGCFADYVRTPYTVFVKGVGPCSDGVDKVVVFGGVESCEGVGGVGVFGLVRSDVFSDCASGMDGLLNIDIVEEKAFWMLRRRRILCELWWMVFRCRTEGLSFVLLVRRGCG